MPRPEQWVVRPRRFDDACLDTSGVPDVRGSRIPGGRATMGAGIVALVLGLFLGVGPERPGLSGAIRGATPTSSSAAQVQQSCLAGEDANTEDDCRTVAVVNGVQDYWRQESERSGETYAGARTVLFGDRVGTACGSATSAAGPGPEAARSPRRTWWRASTATTYKNQLGTLGRAQDGRQGADSGSVKVELQADCYAGVRAGHATATPAESGLPLVTELTEADIRDGLEAAAAVGDGRVREKFRGA